MSFRQIVKIALSIAILLFFLLHASGIVRISLIDFLESIAYDIRLTSTMPNRNGNQVHTGIIIADIDEDSLAEIGQWPWGRDILATLVDTLFDHYQIKTLGFDVVFAEHDQSSGLDILEQLASGPLAGNTPFLSELEELRPTLEYDTLFADSLRYRNVALGYVFNQHDAKAKFNQLPLSIGPLETHYRGKLALFRPKGYTANIFELQQSVLNSGFVDNPQIDRDGSFRSVPLVQEYAGNLYESLALAIARATLAFPELKINIQAHDNYYAIEHIGLGDRIIPVDESATVLIPYRGYERSFLYLSIADILNKKTPQHVLKDKIVIVGTTAPGLKDLRSTPVGKVYPGVEVHANVVSGILEGHIKHQPAYTTGLELVVLLLLGAVMIFLTPFLSPLWTSIFTLALLTGVIAANLFAWEQGLVLPITSSILCITTLFVLQMSYGFFIESRGKRLLTKLFGQYIPPELVKEIAMDPTHISLDGQSRELTVLFCDIRDFTHISEKLAPQELTQLMNSFLTPMTQIIHKHRGTIDKYIGDSVMAFWGAPLNDPHHAKNALNASLEMLAKLDELQAVFRQRGWPEIRIGVGINTGIMNVGNMGSEFRMAYTVMGDEVNLGSRLEGLSKQYGTAIIVSEASKQAIPEFEFLELDRVRVKGKDQPITIYQPIGLSIELSKDEKSEIRRFHQALQFYRAQAWDKAEQEIFSLAQSTNTKDRVLYQIYLERIAYFRNNPPGDHWDYIFTHTRK